MITEEIIKKAQEGDSEAFAIIYNETVKTAYYVAKRILISEEATEDVLQEAYIAVYKHLSDYRSGNFQGWVDTIVANRAKNYLRKENPILFSEMESEERPVVEFEEEKIEFRPEEKVDYNETQRLILEIIDNLSPEQRLAVILFYFESRHVKEIAEICECSENTVKSRLNYARKKIKEDVLELEKKGTKLYSIVIMPFIMWMLAEKANAAEVPEGLAEKVLASIGAAAGSVSGSTVGATSVASTTAGASTGTVGATVAATKVGMALGVKIAIGITVAVITTGAVITGVAIKNNEDTPKDNVNVTSEVQNEEEDSQTNNKLEADAEETKDDVKEEKENTKENIKVGAIEAAIEDAKEKRKVGVQKNTKENEKVIKTKMKKYLHTENYEYDENGKEIEYLRINDLTGATLEHSEYVYDEAGKLTQIIEHETPHLAKEYIYEKYGNSILRNIGVDSGSVAVCEIEYDDAGKVSVICKDKSGSVLDRMEFSYSENGKIKLYVTEFEYYEYGTVLEEVNRADYFRKCIVSFDENGNQKFEVYGNNGKLVYSGEEIFDYYGNVLIEVFYEGNETCSLVRFYEYEYDDNTNVIREIKNERNYDQLRNGSEGCDIYSIYEYTYYE